MEDTIVPMTAAQLASRDRAYEEMRRLYPGHYVAYLDEWDGDNLRRTVLAASPDLGGYRDLVTGLPEDITRRLQAARVPEPDEPIFASRLLFDPPT